MRRRLSLFLAVLATIAVSERASAQGVLNELKAWEDATPIREAEKAASRARESAELAPCKGDKGLCRTQLMGRGWQVLASGQDLTGVDTGLTFDLVKLGDQSQLCITFFSYDGRELERPCHEIKARLEPVKD